MKLISVFTPCYNEEENVDELYQRVKAVFDGLPQYKYEHLFIDNASTDQTVARLKAIAANDPKVKIIVNLKNFGQVRSPYYAMMQCMGEAVIGIVADLQDPPEVIPELAAKWKEGYEVVYAVRAEREGETWFKKTSAALFYRLIRWITDVNIPVDTGDFRLMDRKVVNVLVKMKERHRFPRGMSAWVGFKQIGVEYKRAARIAGVTKYPFRKMLKLAMNAITGFSYFPLQVATYVGFFSAGIAILAIPVVAILRLAGSHFFEGQTTTLISVLFLGGVQLISLGILGEYVGRLYDEAKGRPLYIVREAPKD